MQYRYLEARGALNQAARTSAPPPPLRRALVNVPPAILALMPESVAQENNVLPLALDGETLTVAAPRADDLPLADKLSFMLNKKVRLVPFPRAEIRAAVAHHYGDRVESVDSMLQEFTDTPVCIEELCLDKEIDKAVQGAFPRRWPARAALGAFASAAPRVAVRYGEDNTRPLGGSSMFFHVVEEGQRVLMRRPDGTMAVIIGPKRIWIGRNLFKPMRHFVAHPGQR